MPHHTPLISTIVAGLVLAFIFGAIANRLRLPPLVGYLVAGIAIGPFTPGFVGDLELAGELAEIGVILLMFGVGLHFSLDDLLAVKGIAIPGAVAQIALATLMGVGLAWAIGWPIGEGVIFGLALSVASTVVLLTALQERRLVETKRGQIAVGWLIVEDIAMVLALVLIPALSGLLGGKGEALTTEQLMMTLAVTLGKVAAFVAVMLVVGRRLIPWILERIASTGNRELFRLGVLAIALGFALGAAYGFGVSFALGAFFAGMILSESELSHRAAEESLPLRDAFAVLFFVSVGMLFNPNILVREPWLVLATFLVVTVGKPAAAFVLLRALGHAPRLASTIAATVSQIGEFSFILAGLAVALKVLPPEGRDLVLAAALLSIVANPIIFHWVVAWQKRETAERKAASEALADAEAPAGPALPTAGHTIVVGYGRVGAQLAALLKERGVDVVVIDDSRDLIDRARADGVPAVRGNAAAAERLAELSPETATRALLAIPNAFEAGEIVSRLRKANPAMTILARAHSEPEMRHLLASGADGAVLAERELAYSMAEMVLGAPGASGAP